MRDYDKEPIVIKDMNLLFSVLFQIPLILACCLVAIFKPGTNILFCSVIMFAPHLVPYFKYKNKRFIKITNEKIYCIKLSCNDIIFSVCINENDLIGEPMVGRRFKGNIWMQGSICL